MMRAMFFAIIGALRHEMKLSEPIPYEEYRDAIKHPLSWREIMKFKRYKIINLFFWGIGKLNPSASVAIIKIIGKTRHLI